VPGMQPLYFFYDFIIANVYTITRDRVKKNLKNLDN